MADEADLAQREIERTLAMALANRKPDLTYNGKCHFCRTPVPHPNRFCDIDCRDDWEKRNKTER